MSTLSRKNAREQAKNSPRGNGSSQKKAEEVLAAFDTIVMNENKRVKSEEIEYKRMGDLEVGDQPVASDGTATVINNAYDEHIPESMYRLRFANGEIIEASGNHLWYTVNLLDKQLHKERIKRAEMNVLPKLYPSKTNWLKKTANVSLEDSPAVDIGFLFEILDVDLADRDLIWSITRVLESIGPVAVRNELIFDERVDAIVDAGERETRLYSLSLFCQQMLALCAEALKDKNSVQYELYKGRVRTTEEIAETWELKHDFPSVRVM